MAILTAAVIILSILVILDLVLSGAVIRRMRVYEAAHTAPPDRGGIASGVINAARQAGGVLGVALLGTLVPTRAGFAAGLELGVALSAAAFLLGAVLTAIGVPPHHGGAKPADGAPSQP